jgi:hypothetical protein
VLLEAIEEEPEPISMPSIVVVCEEEDIPDVEFMGTSDRREEVERDAIEVNYFGDRWTVRLSFLYRQVRTTSSQVSRTA